MLNSKIFLPTDTLLGDAELRKTYSEGVIITLKKHEIVFGWSSVPDMARGAYNVLSDLLFG